jgi:hypothetical protein
MVFVRPGRILVVALHFGSAALEVLFGWFAERKGVCWKCVHSVAPCRVPIAANDKKCVGVIDRGDEVAPFDFRLVYRADGYL